MKIKNDPFYKELKELVIPITIQSFMLALVSATDALMLGLVDQTSLSAVSLAGQIQFILNMFVQGIAAGSAILIAQYWGKKDVATVERTIPIALRMNLIFGGMFTLAAFFAPEFLIKIYTDEPELIAAGAQYLKAVSLSYVLCGLSQVYLTMLKNTGLAKLASKISSTAVILNIVLNGILIFGLLGFPALGVEGAAYATVIARFVELAWSFLETRKPNRVQVRWNLLFARAGDLEKDFWKYATPVLGAALVWGVAFSLYSVIMGHLGSDAVAANSVTSIIQQLVSCLIRGLSGGTGIVIGNLLGAGMLAKAKEYGARLTHLAILVGVISGLLMMGLAFVVPQLTTLTPQAAGYMKYMMIFCGINIMFQSVNTTVLDGIFCAGGDSKFDMIGNIFAMWCVTVPMGFLGAFYFKLAPMIVYCIIRSDEIIKVWAVYLRYKKYIWLKDITRATDTDCEK